MVLAHQTVSVRQMALARLTVSVHLMVYPSVSAPQVSLTESVHPMVWLIRRCRFV